MELKKYCLRPEMENEGFYQRFQNKFHEGKIYFLEKREYNIPNSANNTQAEQKHIPVTVSICLYLDNNNQHHIAAMDSKHFNEYFVKDSANE